MDQDKEVGRNVPDVEEQITPRPSLDFHTSIIPHDEPAIEPRMELQEVEASPGW